MASPWDAHDWDEDDNDYDRDDVVCKRCGMSSLHWQQITGGGNPWRLFTDSGRPHQCPAAVATDADFD